MKITKEMEDKINEHISSINEWFTDNHPDDESITITMSDTHRMLISSDGKTICYGKVSTIPNWVNIVFLPTATKLKILENWTYIKQAYIAEKKRIANQNQKTIDLINNFTLGG